MESRNDLAHLILVNLGTPTAPTAPAVREFLAEFLSDPAVVDLPAWLWQPILRGIILRRRPARVAHQYATIWRDDGSPLRVATGRMVAGVRALAGGRFAVVEAYRYGEPSLASVMNRLARESTGPVIVVPLFPQRTDATTATARCKATEAAEEAGVGDRLVNRLIAPDDPGYIEALADRWRTALANEPEPDHLVVSFHGIPTRYDRREGQTYTKDCALTTRAFLSAIGWPADRATLAYQSKFGPEPWLKPATADLLEGLPKRGVRSVAVVTPGFLTEGLETLEEIAIRGRESFVEAGGERFLYIAATEDHPALLASLARLALP